VASGSGRDSPNHQGEIRVSIITILIIIVLVLLVLYLFRRVF
jgi:hypothetical protein